MSSRSDADSIASFNVQLSGNGLLPAGNRPPTLPSRLFRPWRIPVKASERRMELPPVCQTATAYRALKQWRLRHAYACLFNLVDYPHLRSAYVSNSAIWESLEDLQIELNMCRTELIHLLTFCSPNFTVLTATKRLRLRLHGAGTIEQFISSCRQSNINRVTETATRHNNMGNSHTASLMQKFLAVVYLPPPFPQVFLLSS